MVAPEGFEAGPSCLWKMAQKLEDEKGKQTWKCPFCQRCFNCWNATKVLFHFSKAPGGDIQACMASVPPWLVEAGRAKVGEKNAKKKLKTQAQALIDSAANERLSSVGAAVQSERKRSSASVSLGAPESVGNAPIFQAMGVSASTALSAAIGEMIHADGLSNKFAESPRLAKVLKLARSAPSSFKPPGRKAIGGVFLDKSADNLRKDGNMALKEHAADYGWACSSDGATIRRVPLVNILGFLPFVLPPLLALVDCSGHMSTGGKKDGLFLYDEMKARVVEVGSRSCYLWLLDGASNEVGCGSLLENEFPWSTTLHGAEHTVHLVMSSIHDIPEVKRMHDEHNTLFNFFQNQHNPKAILDKHVQLFNKGR